MATQTTKVTGEQLLSGARRFFWLFVGVYLVFLVGNSVYQNYRIQRQVSQAEADITNLKEQNLRLSVLNEYYQTATYQELEARIELGLKNPGETVIALPDNTDKMASPTPAPTVTSSNKPTPNYIKWWEYLLGSGQGG